MIPQANASLKRFYGLGGLQDEIACFIGHVVSVCVDPADDHALQKMSAAVYTRYHRRVHLTAPFEVYPQILEQFQGLLFCDPSRFQVFYIKGIEENIHPCPDPYRDEFDLMNNHVNQPEALQCFVKGPRRIGRNPVACLRNLQELFLSRLVGLIDGCFPGFCGESTGKFDGRFKGNDGRIQKILLLKVVIRNQFGYFFKPVF
jgi:hypothetical protein